MPMPPRSSRSTSQYRPDQFFVLRTPLLSVDELRWWSEATDGTGATRAQLRRRLETIVTRPEVREALWLASPSLQRALPGWQRDPHSKAGQQTERALVRYVQRMASRPTPFGMFAGCSLGAVTPTTRLVVAPRRHASIDADVDLEYLSALTSWLAEQPELRDTWRYHPNSTLHRTTDDWHYVEMRPGDPPAPHVVSIAADLALDLALRCAIPGVGLQTLVEALVTLDPDAPIAEQDARDYVHALVQNQVLVPDLGLTLTGPRPLEGVVQTLRRADATPPLADTLERCGEALSGMGEPGMNMARYETVAEHLGRLPVDFDPGRGFRVTMTRPAPHLSLATSICDEMARGVEALRRLARPLTADPLAELVDAFRERYGDREVPLLTAMDPNVGLGFGGRAHATPLLDDVNPRADPPSSSTATARDARWLDRLAPVLRRGDLEWDLQDHDIEALGHDDIHLPDAWSVVATVVGRANARASADVAIHMVTGPSGARLFGRFCDHDPALRERVRAHLRAEEQLHPEAIYAEVVHMPPGRIANVSRRPCLRRFEIPYWGRSGAPGAQQIPVSDLRLRLRGDRLVLRSASMQREIIPRTTSAFNPMHPQVLPLGRLLRQLEAQGQAQTLQWDWAGLSQLSFLPRVRYGRCILSRARWRLDGLQLQRLAAGTPQARHHEVQRLRAQSGWPSLVLLKDGDNELCVDLDNPLSIEGFVHLVKRRDHAVLTEPSADASQLIARDADGRLTHEVVVPFLRKQPDSAQADGAPRTRLARRAAPVQRSFAPGSRWLTAKIYCAAPMADSVLADVVGPWIRDAKAQGIASWHFLRYADPDFHLRVRVHGPPPLLHGRLLSRLHLALEPWLGDGRVWRLRLDGYQREVERYGGPQGIALAERMFEADSQAVLEIVEMLDGEQAERARWQLTVVGIDSMLTDLGLRLSQRHALMLELRAAYGREFDADHTDLRHRLGKRFRKERTGLARLLDPTTHHDHPLAPGLAVLQRRSSALATVAVELHRQAAAATLGRTIPQLAASLVHIHAVRMLMIDPRAHELVLYDFLRRLYEARLARARHRSSPSARSGQRVSS